MATGTRSFVAVMTVVALSALILPVAVAGEETVSILGMAWTPKPAPALVVSATGPLSYTETRRSGGVVVIDFAQAILAAPLLPVQEPGNGLRHAEASVVDEGGRQFTRLRLEVEDGVEVAVSALPAGIELRFAAGAQGAPAAVAGRLGDLLAVADTSGVSVLLAGGGPFAGKTFTLANPPRVVLDLPGVVNDVSRRVHPVDAAGVQRVRVAQFATAPKPIVRVVVDLDQAMPYSYEATTQGGVLRVGAAAGMLPAFEPPPVVAAAPVEDAPIQIAVEPPIPLPEQGAPLADVLASLPRPQRTGPSRSLPRPQRTGPPRSSPRPQWTRLPSSPSPSRS